MGKILLVTHEYPEACYELSQIEGLLTPDNRVERFTVDANAWELPPLRDFEAIVFFVRFRELNMRSQLPWGDYSGLKVLLDQDAFMDFTGWHGRSPYQGMWTDTFKRLNFDLLLCTGIRSAEHFHEHGIRAEVLHKAFDERYFFSKDQPRTGIGYYGSSYSARRKMLKQVRRSGFHIDELRSRYTTLNDLLNDHLSVLVCNMTSIIPLGKLGLRIEYWLPGSLMQAQPSPEPMIKNFEAMGSGCSVFTDVSADDQAVGFVDGETCVVYSDFDDLVDKLRHYEGSPDALTAIGQRGAQLVRVQHTWAHRGNEFRQILDRILD